MRTTIKPRATKSVSTLTKEMDSVFALYVKLRDCDASGTVTCFVTGERIYFRDCDAAHFIDRTHMATRWTECNVHACSVESNRYDMNHKEQYRVAMIIRYGASFVYEIEDRGRSFMKWTSGELIELIEEYKLKVAQLKLEKGL